MRPSDRHCFAVPEARRALRFAGHGSSRMEGPQVASSRPSTCHTDESRVACLATGLSVPCKPFVSGGGSQFFELIWDIVAGAEVHLIGCLTTKRRVRETSVVLVHIERNQLLHRVDGVEGVQVQPLVFEHSPPRLDQRVGVGDFGHGEEPSENPRFDQLIDGTVEVLDTTVREKSWSLVEEAT